jgi:hypothetical protein
MQDAAFRHDNACDCCGHDPAADKLEALEDAIKADPGFIAEALVNISLADLVTAYKTVDLQFMWDAVSDIIDAHYVEQLRFVSHGLNDLAGVEKLAASHGVML